METKYRLDMLRAHQVYRNSRGEKLPGVTTVTGLLNKGDALMAWAYECGLKGQDYRKVRDAAADIGTLTHGRIEAHLRGLVFEEDGFPAPMLEQSRFGLERFKAWWNQERLTMVHSEVQMVSEDWQVGGTADATAMHPGGDVILIDVKSGKAVYREHRIQICAYAKLYQGCYGATATPVIVRVGKTEKDDMEIVRIGPNEQAAATELFAHLVQVHRLLKEVKA